MLRQPQIRSCLFIAVLAMLCVRALTPDGYMPGSRGSGLLFELCPAGMPQEVMRMLSGGGQHHHHHGGKGTASVSDPEQCPIGHMLSSAAAADSSASSTALPDTTLFKPEILQSRFARTPTVYRSRAPPRLM